MMRNLNFVFLRYISEKMAEVSACNNMLLVGRVRGYCLKSQKVVQLFQGLWQELYIEFFYPEGRILNYLADNIRDISYYKH